MELWKAIETVGARNLRFGLKEPRPAIMGRPVQDHEIKEWPVIEWYPGISPAQTQWLDNCESEAECNLLEWYVWRRTGQRIILDAEKVYIHARTLIYGGGLSGGLLMGDSAKALIDMGVIPATTIVKRIPPYADSMIRALSDGPLCTGHRIWDGWMPSNLNRENGCVDESKGGQMGMGHATLCVGSNVHNGVPLFVHVNSWGPYSPMNGMFAMTPQYSIANLLDESLQLIIPHDWGYKEEWKSIEKQV